MKVMSQIWSDILPLNFFFFKSVATLNFSFLCYSIVVPLLIGK